MSTATMTSKGQTVIPKPIRDYLGLHVGDQVDFIIQDEHTVLLKAASQDVKHLKGLLHRTVRKMVTLEDMHTAVLSRGGRLP